MDLMSGDLVWVVIKRTFFYFFFEILTSGSGSSILSKIKYPIMMLSSGSAYKWETISSYPLSKFLFRMVAGIFMFTVFLCLLFKSSLCDRRTAILIRS